MYKRLKKWLAWHLRYTVADRIDPEGAPRMTGMSFYFKAGEGAVVTWDNRGCPLWYLGEEDYERAHSEGDF